MLYTKLTKKAMLIAYQAHQNQLDKAGMPYIFHSIHVAEQMETEIECIVALLHDVLEDSDISVENLKDYFPKEVIDALILLTHDKKIDYMDYIRRIKQNKIATYVKIADMKHNSDLSRFDKVTKKDIVRCEKYKKALEILESDFK